MLAQAVQYVFNFFWYAYQVLFNGYWWPKRLKELRGTPQYQARKRICEKIWFVNGLFSLAMLAAFPGPAGIIFSIIMLFSTVFVCFQILENTVGWNDEER
jgi:hypothetical protein